MLRSKVKKLDDPTWVDVPGSDLKLCVKPSGAGSFGRLFLDPNDEDTIKQICETTFVDFDGYEDDTNGEVHPIPNTIEARMELYSVTVVRTIINTEVNRLQSEVVKGGD